MLLFLSDLKTSSLDTEKAASAAAFYQDYRVWGLHQGERPF